MYNELSNLRKIVEMFTGNSIVPYNGIDINIPKEAKTVLFTDFNDDLTAIGRLNNNFVFRRIIPDIKDVRVNNHGKSPIVIVEFCDGTSEKAILSEEDTFNLEQGVSVCITKKLLSMVCPNGSSLYNKIIKRAINIFENRLRNEENALMEKEKEEERRERKRKKNEERREKRELSEREKQIEIHKEAYLRAMREYNKSAETKVE